jgi:hypothetical protein
MYKFENQKSELAIAIKNFLLKYNGQTAFFMMFLFTFITLSIIGSKPIELPYLFMGRIFTFFYFLYFFYIIIYFMTINSIIMMLEHYNRLKFVFINFNEKSVKAEINFFNYFQNNYKKILKKFDKSENDYNLKNKFNK